jgi:hypothetical protein
MPPSSCLKHSFRNWLYYVGEMQEKWPPHSRSGGSVGSAVRAYGERAASGVFETIFAFHAN